MRRITRRNADIASEMRIAVPTSEQYAIFRAYLDSRHRDGGMADMTVLDYAMMVEDSHIETRIIEYRRREPPPYPAARAAEGREGTKRASGDLVAIALTDVLGDGLSMVYSFFEPDEAAARSAPSWCSTTSHARSAWASLTSISATGCAARARWTTRAAFCRRSG